MSNLQTKHKHQDLIYFPRSSGLTHSDLQPRNQIIMAAVNMIQTNLDVFSSDSLHQKIHNLKEVSRKPMVVS